MTVIADNLPTFVEGFLVTLRLTLLSAVLALVLGVVLAALRVSPLRPLRGFAAVWYAFLMAVGMGLRDRRLRLPDLSTARSPAPAVSRPGRRP